MSTLALVIGIAVFTLDFVFFWRAYKNRNIFALAFFGVLLIILTITISGQINHSNLWLEYNQTVVNQ